ncbi:MAG: hypothetical protein NC388_10810 [Clostridium sp.]|nr:hypothetical protein [Clostridium sp.]
MKRKVLLIGLLTLLAIPIHSQENNVSFFSEGKVWNYHHKMIDSDFDITPYTISVVEQTTYNGIPAWIVYDNWRNREYVKYEKESQVYSINSDYEPEIEYDFGVQLGYKTEPYGEVVAIDNISVKGYTRKRITLKDEGHRIYYIVEGIGQNLELVYIYDDGEYFFCSFCYELQSVYENGECIFTKEDFFAEPATGIQEIEAEHKADTRIYDLNGRPVTTPRPNGLYIRNRQVFRQPKH